MGFIAKKPLIIDSNLKIESVFFSFGGVMTDDLFFSGYKRKSKQKWELIQNKAFKNKSIFQDYKRGEYNYRFFLEELENETRIPYKELEEELLISAYNLRIDLRFATEIAKIRQAEIKTILVTDNIDIFDQIITKTNKLFNFFDYIYNSYNFGLLKTEENGRLFDLAIYEQNINSLKNSVLIDNNFKTLNLFHKKGGHVLPKASINYSNS